MFPIGEISTKKGSLISILLTISKRLESLEFGLLNMKIVYELRYIFSCSQSPLAIVSFFLSVVGCIQDIHSPMIIVSKSNYPVCVKHPIIHFLTMDFSIQNGVSFKLSNVITSLQRHRRVQPF